MAFALKKYLKEFHNSRNLQHLWIWKHGFYCWSHHQLNNSSLDTCFLSLIYPTLEFSVKAKYRQTYSSVSFLINKNSITKFSHWSILNEYPSNVHLKINFFSGLLTWFLKPTPTGHRLVFLFSIWNFSLTTIHPCAALGLVAQSCLTLCDPMDCSRPGPSVHGDSPGNNTGVGCYTLLQGIFPRQGSNPGLLHNRQILYHLSHQASPRILEKEMAIHSSILAWEIPWTEEPGGVQSMGSQKRQTWLSN